MKGGRTIGDELEITEVRFDHGYISPCFVTDVKRQRVEFKKLLILLSRRRFRYCRASFLLLRLLRKLAGLCSSSPKMLTAKLWRPASSTS